MRVFISALILSASPAWAGEATWIANTRSDPITDVSLHRAALITGARGLVVGCAIGAEKTVGIVGILSRHTATKDGSIAIRTDHGAPVRFPIEDTQENMAYAYPAGARMIELANQLLNADVVAFGGGDNSIGAEAEVSDDRTGLATVLVDCGYANG